MSSGAYENLPTLGQALITIAIAIGSGLATWQGLRAKNRREETSAPPQADLGAVIPGPVPIWAMMGPVHEVMQTIHDMAEESRKSTAIAADTLRMLERLDRGQDYMLRLTEAVLRNQEMREDYRPSPPQMPDVTKPAQPFTTARHGRNPPHPAKED